MLLDEDKVTEAAQFQRQRCAAFGARTAETIRAAKDCQFSLLPHEELARLASGWYDASAQAMLYGNFAPIDRWTQGQAQLAAAENFELEDMLGLLRICRSAAIQDEKWSEDIFSVVDEAINEALRCIGSAVSWNIPASLDYLRGNTGMPERAEQPSVAQLAASKTTVPPAPISEAWSGKRSENRRDFGRNCLKLPIRVRAAAGAFLEELTHSENVSRSGLYFVTRRSAYKLQMALKITYPYWTERTAINQEYNAKVVRLDRLRDGLVGVAVEFTDGLGAEPRN
jgi:hypothetical protein